MCYSETDFSPGGLSQSVSPSHRFIIPRKKSTAKIENKFEYLRNREFENRKTDKNIFLSNNGYIFAHY